MKKTIKSTKTIPERLYIVLILIVLSPLIVGLLITWVLFFGIPMAYATLWSRIRHDPKTALTVTPFEDESWSEAYTKDPFVASYDRLSKTIERLSGAKGQPVRYDGFEVFENYDYSRDWSDLRIEQVFIGKGANARARLDSETDGRSGTESSIVMPDGDDQIHMKFPPLQVKVTMEKLDIEREFILWDETSAWFLIGILRGDYRYNNVTNQPWVRLKENNVWIVGYRADKHDFGLRHEYSSGLARKYWWDSKELTA